MKSVDLVGSWTTFWGTISSAITGPVKTTIIVIGIGLILYTVVKYVWDKRRGGGGKTGPVWWTLIFGGILIAPDALLPLFLSILQWAINLGLKVISPIWG
jgi:hypothetical protein